MHPMLLPCPNGLFAAWFKVSWVVQPGGRFVGRSGFLTSRSGRKLAKPIVSAALGISRRQYVLVASELCETRATNERVADFG